MVVTVIVDHKQKTVLAAVCGEGTLAMYRLRAVALEWLEEEQRPTDVAFIAEPCDQCEGTGQMKCENCSGTGECVCDKCEEQHSCGRCEGNGQMECENCSGTDISDQVPTNRPAIMRLEVMDWLGEMMVTDSQTHGRWLYAMSMSAQNEASA